MCTYVCYVLYVCRQRPQTRGHVPYRNCLLTMALKDSLGKCTLHIILYAHCTYVYVRIYVYYVYCTYIGICIYKAEIAKCPDSSSVQCLYSLLVRWELLYSDGSHSLSRGDESGRVHLHLSVCPESRQYSQSCEVSWTSVKLPHSVPHNNKTLPSLEH